VDAQLGASAGKLVLDRLAHRYGAGSSSGSPKRRKASGVISPGSSPKRR
jgi:hypothetical protein